MSLTQLVRTDGLVRSQLRDAILRPAFARPTALVAPRTKRYNVTGTAFDYLLRFTLERDHARLHSGGDFWVAEAALKQLPGTRGKRARQFVAQTRQLVAAYRRGEEVTLALARATTVLAKLDLIYRSGWVDETLLEVEEVMAQELLDLLAVVPWAHLRCEHTLLTNPNFGPASFAVGGADADLVLDRTLVDIKTTQEANLPLDELRQLVGYYLLWRLGGLYPSSVQNVFQAQSTPPLPVRLERLGIYYARHGKLVTFPVEAVLRETHAHHLTQWLGQYIGLLPRQYPRPRSRAPTRARMEDRLEEELAVALGLVEAD